MQILKEGSRETEEPLVVKKFRLMYNPEMILANCMKAELALGLNATNVQIFMKILPNVTDLYLKIKLVDPLPLLSFDHYKVRTFHLDCDSTFIDST